MRHLSGFIAFGHGKDTGAGDLHDTDRFECVEENGDAFGCVAHLDHHLIAGHIYNARAHDLTVIHNIPAVSTVVFDLYKQKLAVDALRLIKGLDFDDIQFFVELFFDLLDTSLSSVSPTVMESMLKQRRQKRPAVLQRTPARFSTRMEYILFIDTKPPTDSSPV